MTSTATAQKIGRQVPGTDFRFRAIGLDRVLYTAEGVRLGCVAPTRGTSADWGNKWVDTTDRNARFMNLAEAARYFAIAAA